MEKRRISIFYSSVALNPPLLSFAYAVPAGSPQIILEELMHSIPVRYLLWWLLLGSAVCFTQSQDEIRRRQDELNGIRNQIRELESKSKQQQANES